MKPCTRIWKCKDGRKVRVCDMTDSHLLNTIAMLERNASALLAQEISAAYSCLSMLQGEMATYYCERDIDRLEETSPGEFLEATQPIYTHLCNEADRRKLKLL